ncbi:MAG: MBL fold metallo-hydrolase [Candidatus Loosdrechtia sp.]|uniref:MBL fold metallo-hydrolase n=1 Tax=Candidatus Loosdrechtia sp. TaxID=3101272 RepID=UPI003A5DC345|nr:MAG: ribonuclease Z [Candidatus Jettenia sp. AMX2]
MELTIIGSGSGMPSKTRAYPCVLLKMQGANLVFDTGPGSLRQLLFADITYLDIDHIYYTHFHLDHSLDLASILFTMRYNEPQRTRPLFITGPPGLKAFYEGLLTLYEENVKPKHFDLHMREIDKGVLVYDTWKIIAEPLLHAENSIGFRIESADNRVLVYSGDTDYCDGILRLAKKANTLILECSFPDDSKIEGHLTPLFCAKIAHEAQCDRLILTHFYPSCDRAVKENKDLLKELRNTYQGEIIFAEDFAKFII